MPGWSLTHGVGSAKGPQRDGRGEEDAECEEDFDEEDEEEEEGDDGDGAKGMSVRRYAKICSCICFCSLIVFVNALAGAAYFSVKITPFYNNDTWHDARVTPPEFPRYAGCNGCPVGNKSDDEIAACGAPCFTLQQVLDWEAFNMAHDWSQVFFPSREGPAGQSVVNISAWWLPADTSRLPKDSIPPRLVLLHGVASNNNHCGVQMTAFLLRTMGFSVLAPTLRNWGLSGKSATPDIVSWGWDYHYDLLGAWDYAVADPDGVMGGPLPDRRVGIIGFSMGGFVAQIAFGLEARVPAAYIFSGPAKGFEEMIETYVSYVIGAILAPLISRPMYWFANMWAGVDLAHELPWEVIQDCLPITPSRKMGISNAHNDRAVPIVNAVMLAAGIGNHPECYDLVQLNTPTEDCNGFNHHVSMWQNADRMRERLCSFWSLAFERNATLCGLDELPQYGVGPRPLPDVLWSDLKCNKGR